MSLRKECASVARLAYFRNTSMGTMGLIAWRGPGYLRGQLLPDTLAQPMMSGLVAMEVN